MNESFVTMDASMNGKEQTAMAGIWRYLDDSARRGLDVITALIGFIILSPVFLLIAILIKRDSPGPVFYWGERVGRNERPFNIVKFRTMYEDTASYNGPKVTGQGDPRITPLGNWLRDTKLNELPQLWNVLKGDMSFVGPRPEDRDFVAHWPNEARQVLLSVRPGITSPASVLYRDEESMLSKGNVVDQYLKVILPSKLRLDLLYVHNRSLLTDVDVLFWTLMALLPQLKTKRVPEHLLFWGPWSRFMSRYFSWFVLDSLSAFVAVAITGVIWRSNGPLELGLGLAIGVALAIAFIFSMVNALLGVGSIVWSRANMNDALMLAASTGLTTLILIAINLVWEPRVVPVPYLGHQLLPTGLILVTGTLAFAGFAFMRYRMRIITGLSAHWINLRGKSAAVGERVLIIGAGEAGQLATYLLQNTEMDRAFTIVGLVDDAPRIQGSRIDGVSVLGSSDEIPELVNLHDVGLIVFAIEKIHPTQKKRILRVCQNVPVQTVVLTDVLESLRSQFLIPANGEQPVESVNDLAGTDPGLQAWLHELEDLMEAQAWDAAQESIQEKRRQLVYQDQAG